MPLYEYECPKCGIIEIEHKISETITQCPECSKGMKSEESESENARPSELKRLISSTSFVLKGKGWYKTDYKKS